MNLCIPVAENQAGNSVVHGHFGSAPLFLLVDSETLAIEPLTNRNEHHEHGACNPLQTLAGHAVDALIVGGIGAGAVQRLRQAGLAVYYSPEQTVAEAVAQFNTGTLPELDARQTCAGHAGGGGCQH